MAVVKNWYMQIITSAAALALIVALASLSSTCFFTAYQPDVPKALQD
jgi:cyclic lactone autoinducer peptide